MMFLRGIWELKPTNLELRRKEDRPSKLQTNLGKVFCVEFKTEKKG